jgi:D-3-phosphoglycerate dehydrogenase
MAALIPYIDLAEKLGRLAAQIGEPRASSIEITACGDIARYDLEYVEAAAVKGFLDEVVDARVNLVNAKTIAAQRHISLQRHKRMEADRYSVMLSQKVSSDGQSIALGGTVTEASPYVVNVDGCWVLFPARGRMLLVRHHDRPGVIGKVGTSLGVRDINISFMYVGREKPRGEAVMVMGVDERVPDSVLREILDMPHTYWVKQAEL